MSFSIPLNSDYYELKKQVEKNLDAYKLTVKDNLLVQHLIASTTKKASILSMRFYTYKNKWYSQALLEGLNYNERLTTH